MGLVFILISALFAAAQNFFMRRSQDHGALTQAYVPTQLFISFLINILLNPVGNQAYAWSTPYVAVGLVMGAFLGLMMWGLARALRYGSPGLTFAILNSSSVLPAVIMGLAFGAALGHPYHWWHILGSGIVIIGIFWNSRASLNLEDRGRWITFTALAVGSFVLFSALLQWRVLLEGSLEHALIPFRLDGSKSGWFLPAIFFSAAISQFFVVGTANLFSSKNLFYGLCGGISNGSSMFFMALATGHALGWENAILFPLFSIAVITICNIWGNLLYNEKIHWWANAVCIAGIIISSVQWSNF